MDIHTFATDGNQEGVLAELEKGIFVDSRNEKGYTPLACAAKSPHASVDLLRLLIDAGANIHAKVGESQRQPLALAACSGSLEKVQVLLDAGADINAESPSGYTALLHIMFRLHDNEMLLPMAEFLVQHGAVMDCESQYRESPLSAAYLRRRWDVVRFLLDAGADPSPLRWSKLLEAVALGSCHDVKELLRVPGALQQRDRFSRTPWLLAAFVGHLDKARLIHAAGIDVNEIGQCGETALMTSASIGNPEMIKWLIGVKVDLELADEFGQTALTQAVQFGHADCVEILLAAGADPSITNEYGDKPITLTTSEEVVRVLVEAGEDIGDVSTEMRRILIGLEGSSTLRVSKSEYQEGCQRRFGSSNPETMDVPFWQEMIRTGIPAYESKSQFGDLYEMTCVWCFNRFGASFTALPDGRYVQIGGEHEDYYDPDFCIYNDVVVFQGDGNFTIYGYPQEVFPPTDFHSATLVGSDIYIIGGLGYHGSRRFGTTPVYRLNCHTWHMEPVTSTGACPGWIYKHKATLSEAGNITIRGGTIAIAQDGVEDHVENNEVFQLDLTCMTWTRFAAEP
ncbi:ankyrin repeat domain-containing protein [Bremerella cremea]|nr:ankyrin repeat domain-containing protein [Bremerella cremea]